jgi:hypothetical protein
VTYSPFLWRLLCTFHLPTPPCFGSWSKLFSTSSPSQLGDWTNPYNSNDSLWVAGETWSRDNLNNNKRRKGELTKEELEWEAWLDVIKQQVARKRQRQRAKDHFKRLLEGKRFEMDRTNVHEMMKLIYVVYTFREEGRVVRNTVSHIDIGKLATPTSDIPLLFNPIKVKQEGTYQLYWRNELPPKPQEDEEGGQDGSSSSTHQTNNLNASSPTSSSSSSSSSDDTEPSKAMGSDGDEEGEQGTVSTRQLVLPQAFPRALSSSSSSPIQIIHQLPSSPSIPQTTTLSEGGGREAEMDARECRPDESSELIVRLTIPNMKDEFKTIDLRIEDQGRRLSSVDSNLRLLLKKNVPGRAVGNRAKLMFSHLGMRAKEHVTERRRQKLLQRLMTVTPNENK